jgi:hypothetical protein
VSERVNGWRIRVKGGEKGKIGGEERRIEGGENRRCREE